MSSKKDPNPTTTEEMIENLPNLIFNEDNLELIKEVEKSEVSSARRNIELDKSPGLDGFSISFYRNFQDFIKRDLCKMVNWSLKKGKVGGNTNSTFLSLI